MDLINKIITESSLSRVMDHIERYDIAMITAFRGKEQNCLVNKEEPFINEDESVEEPNIKNKKPREIKKAENLQRNKQLKATLLKLGYGATAIDGSYIENFGTPDSKEVAENSFLVVNLKKDPNFFKNIIKLGKNFCQDSVFLKPENKTGLLYGTNLADFPGLDHKQVVGDFKAGKEAEFFSRVKNKPFTFEHYDTYSRQGKWSITELAKPIITNILD